ncbi:MAG TPA: M13 family metallopeptidase [Acidimicrobiia bacterium]
MELIDHIDPTCFDPETPVGQDFYRHVNGAWLDANPVPPEYPAWGAAYEVHVRNEAILHDLLERAAAEPGPEGSVSRMVGDYFTAGMDTDAITASGIEPLRPLLTLIDSIEDLDGLRHHLVELRRGGGRGFHSLGVSADFEDSDSYLVYLGQGGLGLPDRDYYLRDDERSVALLAAYVDHIGKQLENLGIGGHEEAAAILELETRLAVASLPSEEIRKAEVRYNRYSTDALAELMPRFELGRYVNDLGVTSSSVNIDNPGFFTVLDEALADTPLDVIRAYLRWNLVRGYASAMPAQFEDEAFDFYNRKLGGQQQPRERWTRVLSAAAGDIGEQVARLYVETAFSAEAKERCEELVGHLLAAMGESIRSREWMSDDTKKAALAKLDAFTYKIGYPDEWRDYTGLVVDPGSYLGNRIAATSYEFAREMRRLPDPVDKGEWEMPAHIVNAYYHPMLNEIVFPAGILQPPFFYPDGDDAVNYGAIGTVIGHEITHGFDDNGSQFDERGRRRNWWSEADRERFEARADALADQYSGFTVADDLNVNGRLTLGENIADLGGLKIAYDAFVAAAGADAAALGGFSPEQRFFLSYGTIWRMNYTEEYLRMLVNVDVHSPSRFRVNGPLSNFHPFAAAFAVPEGMPLRRTGEDAIEIW